jgi:hypothetical protein
MRRESGSWRSFVSLCILSGLVVSLQTGCSDSPKRYQGFRGGGNTPNGAGDGAGAMMYLQSKSKATSDRFLATAPEK